MASSRPTSSPDTELRHWLQDLLLESSVEETGKELKRAPAYCLSEVSVGGSLSAVAVKTNERGIQNGGGLQVEEGDTAVDLSEVTVKIADECHRYARLRHPNILQFYGVSFPQTSLLPVVITEKLDFTLSQCLTRFAKLPEYLHLSLLMDVARAINYMHDSSPPLAHGEIDASNIFLTPNLRAKLAYPPIYKMFTTDLQQSSSSNPNNSLNGTALTAIMSNNGGSCKQDIFNYGELMIHVTTHKKPRRTIAGHSPSLLQQVEHIENSHVLRGLIMQCLQKDPLLRPSASEIVQEILMTVSNQKSPFNDPVQVLNALMDQPTKQNGSSPKGSPPVSKIKKLEQENTQLTAQLKVTQSELRHLRMQQALFGRKTSFEEEEDDENEEIEMKDAAVQVDILQDTFQRVYIELRKETPDQSLGFSIAGGKGTAPTLQEADHGIYITKIATNGLAEKDGRLKIGDKIKSVNGEDLSDVSRADALTILMKSTDVCAMVVLRQELMTESVSGLPPRRLSSVRKRKGSSSSKGKLHPLKLGVSVECEEISTLPEPLTDGQAVLYRGKVIVGGQYSKNCGAIFEYDPEEDTWNTLANSPTWFYSLAVFQDKITVVGGFDVDLQNCSPKLHAWNEREGSWMASLPPMPTARMHSSAISLGSSLVVAGGRNNKATLNCIEVFNFASQQWYSAHPLMLEQSSMKSICNNGFWFLLGGEQQGFASPRALYTPLQSLIDSSFHKHGSVSCFKAIPHLPNTYSAVTILGGKIILIGGTASNSTTSNKIYALAEDPMAWLEVGELPIGLTHSCAVAISDQEVLVIGGRGDDGEDSGEVFRVFLQETSTTSATTTTTGTNTTTTSPH